MSAKARLAVDIGGTFTDVVLELPSSERVTTKLLTTYDHPGRAVLAGIRQVMEKARLDPADVSLIIHGTTLATNALIERRGAVTALLTTEGHRDALEMAHEDRFEQYDINIDRPAPLVPRHLRLPIRERMDRDGNVLVPLDESTIDDALVVIEQHNVESVAIGYLHGFVNPENEARTADRIKKARPDLSLTLASEVAPEIREFERLSTACANAYVRPVMDTYLSRLAGELKSMGLTCPFLLMTSGGGLTTLETATRFPIRLVESGPAGGAILAKHISKRMGSDRLLSFDMGGTTAKLCLIDDGEPLTSRSFEVDRVYRFKKGSGLPVRIPVIEMVEIGAGGGSIASIDKLQRLQVGPESAGSEPGPVAYNKGGEAPTVTDADVHLGKIVPDYFANGAIELSLTKPAIQLKAKLGDQLSMDADTVAFGISEVVDENMTAAARAHAAEFGMDLSNRDLVAYGGAAPLHAARLGEKLGVRKIIIPPDAGVGSAVGFLLAPIAYEVVRSRQQLLSVLDTELIGKLFNDMKAEAMHVIRQGTQSESLAETRQAYMRYVGQGHELAISIPVESPGPEHAVLYRQLFETNYKKLYGHIIEDVEIEILSWTLTIAENQVEQRDLQAPEPMTATGEEKLTGTQRLYSPATGTFIDAPVYLRGNLATGAVFEGPALITESQTTTVVAAGYHCEIDRYGNIVMTRASSDE